MNVGFVYAGYENLGVEYLSASLKKHGHTTYLVFDPQLFNDKFLTFKKFGRFFNIENLIVKKVLAKKPALVAFSVNSSDYLWALRLAEQLKKQNKNILIVFGGIHPTIVPELVLDNTQVDFIIRGEGEQALPALAKAVETNTLLSEIPNLGYKDKGTKIINNTAELITELDQLPCPDKWLFYADNPFLKKEYTLITRRGCRNQCTYCHNSCLKKIYNAPNTERFRSVDNVMAELRAAYKKYRFNKIRINDEDFLSNSAWLKEFSEKYSKEFNVPIWCWVCPASVSTETVQYLKKINCFQVMMGVQTTNEVLKKKVLHRGESNEQIVQAIKLFHEYKIRCVTDNLVGLPTQTEGDLLNLAKFYLENRVGRICIFWLIHYPGLKINDIAYELGYINKEMFEQISVAPIETANTIRNSNNNFDFNKYYILLLLIHFLPKKLIELVIRKKWYNFFSKINPALIEIPMTLLMKDNREVERFRYLKKYFYYVPRIIVHKYLFRC